MRDIVADKILSFLSANNIEYSENNNLIIIPLENQGNIINAFYTNKRFYIDKSNYLGQPHVILHWNPKKLDGTRDIDKYGLCLTMDGSDRRKNELTAEGELVRVKEIIFELWDDPIGERFRELNTTFQTKDCNSYYIDFHGNIISRKNTKKYNKVEYIDIEFTGQSKENLIENINSCFPNSWVLMKLTYKGEIKKIFFSDNKEVFKLNDYTKESFWGRTEQTTNERTAIIVGAGSVGGLVLDSLCKSWFKKIIIYDDDKFDVVNTPRHVFGVTNDKIGEKKSLVLSNHYSNLYPMIDFKGKDEKFKYDSEIPDNSLVFNTTGGSNIDLLINSFQLLMANEKKNFSFIDIFVEPFALGIHSIVFKNDNKSIYKEWPRKYYDDERYIVTPEIDFRKNFDGCFMPTLPYGFAPLQIAIPWLMKIMNENNYEGNHYTIPFLSFFKDKKNILNKKISREINPYRIGVKTWKK